MQSIDLKSGSTLWKTEMGGEIAGELLLSDEKIYTVVRYSENAVTSAPSEVNIRAVSLSTGIGLWQTKFQMPGDTLVYLSEAKGSIVLITDSGKIHVLDEENGAIKFSVDLKTRLDSPPVSHGQNIFFIAGNKIVRFLPSGNIVKFSGAVAYGSRILHSGEEVLLIGDARGGVSMYSNTTLKRRWTVRTGAEVGDLLEFEDAFMIASNDNFVYFVSKKNGRRVWKTRLSERTKATRIGIGTGVFSGVSGKQTVFIDTKDGKIFNRIALSDDNFLINKPLTVGKLLVLQTFKGVYLYSPESCQTKGAL